MATKIFSARRAASLPTDPRYYQIAVLFSLLIYGVGWLNFDVGARAIAILLGTVLTTQFLCVRFLSTSAFDPLSPLISGLSLCLLLRANSAAAAASIRALSDAGVRHFYISNLPIARAAATLQRILDRAFATRR